jgi:hypothetical protein
MRVDNPGPNSTAIHPQKDEFDPTKFTLHQTVDWIQTKIENIIF